MSMLERIAAVIDPDAWSRTFVIVGSLSSVVESDEPRERSLQIARDVLEALREPTEEMYDGVNRLGKMWKDSNSTEVFRAMIDGALKPFDLVDEARKMLASIESMIFAAERETDPRFKAFLALYLDGWKAKRAEIDQLIAARNPTKPDSQC